MEQIIAYIAQYGIPVFVIATCVIAFIDILKVCKVFNKISSKQVKKVLYYICSIVLSFGGSALYFVIFDKAFTLEYVLYSCAQVGATTSLYAIYANLGMRKLLQIVCTKLKEWVAKNPERKTAKALKALGLTPEALTKLQEVAAKATQDSQSTPNIPSKTVTSTTVYNSHRNNPY